MEQEQIKSDANKKTAKGVQIKWWTWVILVIVIIIVGVFAIVKYQTKDSPANDILTKADTAEEIMIKQNISSLRGDIVRYYEEKKTYEGWKPNDSTASQIKAMGSEIKTQALSTDGYIIYAKLPNSKTLFCMDNKGFTSEIKSLSSFAKNCQ